MSRIQTKYKNSFSLFCTQNHDSTKMIVVTNGGFTDKKAVTLLTNTEKRADKMLFKVWNHLSEL